MKNKIILTIIIILWIFLVIFNLYIFYNQQDYKIINPIGNESNYIIETIDCTEIDTKDTDFLIPVKYNKQKYSESINLTHGRYCWYKPIFKENITEEYLIENCSQTSETQYVCEKDYRVNKI